MATGFQILPEISVNISHPDDPVIRILLMGRRKSGKSSSGNTILGERKFKVKRQEAEVCDELTQIGEKQVHVIDCPDLLDPNLNKEQLKMMKAQLVSRCSAGLSAVLLTVPLDHPLENEEESLDFLACLLGPKVQKYIIVLFTHGDELEELDEPQTIDEYLQNQDHADLQRLVTECGGKFHCLNNKCKGKVQVQDLLQKIEGMMEENAGKFIMEQMRRSDSKNATINSYLYSIIIIIIITEEEKNTIEELKEAFGKQMDKYTMILFTHKDQLKEDKQTIEQYLHNGDPDLQTLVHSCGNRFFCLDNNSASFPQFKDLLSKIETMVEENRGTHFTNDVFDETEKHILDIQKQKLDEKVKQYKHVFKIVSQTEWQKIFWRLAEDSRREAEQSFSDMCITAVAKLMGKIEVTPEEKESALKEAEIKGFSHTEAVRLAVKATGTLAKQQMCGIQ